MLVRWRASLTSMSKSASKKSPGAVVHAQADDVAAGLADDRAGLAEHAGRVEDGGRAACACETVSSLGLRRPLQVAPEVVAVLELGEPRAVDRVHDEPLAAGLSDADDAVARHRLAAFGRSAARRLASARRRGRRAGRRRRPRCLRRAAALALARSPSGPGRRASSTWPGVTRPRPTASKSSVLGGGGEPLERRPQRDARACDLPARSKVWSIEARPRRMNSSFSVWRMWRRIAERARPVTASERQSGCAGGLGAAHHLHHVAVGERGAQRAQLAVDLHARRSRVADVGVHRVGEIERHRPARQADQPAFRREDEHLVEEHLELGVLDQVLGVAAVLEHLHQLAQVRQRVAAAGRLQRLGVEAVGLGPCSASGRRRPPRPPGPWPRCGSASRCACRSGPTTVVWIER